MYEEAAGCVALAFVLTEVGAGVAVSPNADRAAVPQALRIYEGVRRERTTRVQALSRANRTRLEASNNLDTRDRQPSSQAMDRAWLANYDAEAEAAAALASL